MNYRGKLDTYLYCFFIKCIWGKCTIIKANAKEMGLIFRGYMARQTERKDLYAGE